MPRFGLKKASSSSSKASARDIEQQSQRETKSKQSSKNSRRRNFGFLGVGRTEKQKDKNVISRRREHAKQLANLAYSDDPTTATSTSTHESAYDMNTTIISPGNNSKNRHSNSKSKNRQRSNGNKSGSVSNSSNVNDAFGSDPFANFDAFGMSAPAPEPPSSTKFSAQNFSELDYFAGQMAGATTPVYRSREHNAQQSAKKSNRRKNQPVSLDHFLIEDDTSSFCSTNDLSTIDNGGGSISSNGASAAARRRMRSHMQSKQSDASSVVSSSLARSRSSPQIPPNSPGVSKYQRSASARNSGWGNNSGSEHLGSSIQRSGSAMSSTSNLFDSENGAGFTFDAFGLDESQVEREVSSAMKDIMGNGGVSIFDDGYVSGSNSESGHGSGNNSVGSGNRSGSFSRQDSFSGNQTDGSEASFEVQKWDSSPNPSRGPSPVPLHFHKSPAGLQKTPVKLSSVQQRRLQRSAQRGTTAVTPQRGNSNSFRHISSEPQAKTKTASQFGAFNSDPFAEDPFASPDDGGRFSGMFANSNGDSNTARRLYADTQSDVHDYYAKGSMNAAANSLLNATTPKHSTPTSAASNESNYARSDIGVSAMHRLSFESPMSKNPGFFELPPADEDGNQGESDQSSNIDQIQDEFAHEFAKDIVRRISPTNRSRSDGRKIQYGDDRIDESESDDQGKQASSAQHSQQASVPSASRFGSFRSRYERSRSAASMAQGRTPTASNPKTDLGRSTYHGSLRSSYNASKSKPNPSKSVSNGAKEESKPIPKWQQSRGAPIEEKKEDDVVARAPNASPPPKINSLRARWEAKTRPSPAPKPVQTASPNAIGRSERAKRSIDNMDLQFEMLTPDIIEQRRQIAKKDKFNNLRKSMGVVDEDTEEEPKSDDPLGNMVLDNVMPRSPPKRSMRSADTKSDIGYSPSSYLNNVDLRKVASPETFSPVTSPVERKMTYRERREIELRAQREEEEAKKASAPQPVERKMNYRERREMELKLQREKEEMQSSEQGTPKKDASPLIKKLRKRINANKKRHSPPQNLDQSSLNNATSVRKASNVVTQSSRATDIHKNEEASEMPSKNPSKMLENMIASRGVPPATKKTDAAIASESVSQNPSKMLENMFASREVPPATKKTDAAIASESASQNPSKMLENMFASRGVPPATKKTDAAIASESASQNPSKMLENMFASRGVPPVVKRNNMEKAKASSSLENFLSGKSQGTTPIPSKPDVSANVAVPDDVSQSDAKSVLSGFLAKKSAPLPSNEPEYIQTNSSSKDEEDTAPSAPAQSNNASGPALKDDPKFERYFRMLKMGLPLEVAKHAMVRDGLDPAILDMDHNKPLSLGVPIKDDPKFTKYFKMLKIGLPMEHVKHAMTRDGLDASVMDQDHNLPAKAVEKKKEKKKKETHRRARLHWKSLGKIMKNSLWDTVQSEVGGISIDEDEFEDLFQAELKASNVLKSPSSSSKKKGAQVRVIDSKRANNGGIILARVKLTHDQMADAVDRIDTSALTAEQIQNVIEYLPTKEERDALEKYMLEGGQDAAEKFDGLCECEKFMVSMMTVKHAKRKIRALLFKLQFTTCMDSITKDAMMIDTACDELINSNRLRQLLGIILQFGNRLNTAGSTSKSKAGGFSLESLSKLSQAKAFDKKTTFLHYIILIVERNNELLLKYYDDIPTVLESVNVFWDQCEQDLEEVENQLENVRRMALHEARATKDSKVNGISDDDSLGELELTLEEEVGSLRASKTGLFTLGAIKQVSALREKMERTRAKCVRLKQYFGVASNTTEPQEIFSVFAQFTVDFKKAKEQVFSKANKRHREERKKARQKTPKKKAAPEPRIKASSHQPNMNKLFGDIQNRKPSNNSTTHDSQNNLQSSRAGLLSSIKERQSPSERSAPSARAGVMDAIKQRNSAGGAPVDPRAGLLASIQQRQPARSAPVDPRAGLMDAIKKRQPASENKPEDSRMSLLSSIKARNPDNSPEKKAPENSRMSLLSSIKARNPDNGTSSPENNPPKDSRMSLLSSIKARNPDSGSPEKSSFGGARSPREAMRHHRRFRHGE